MWVVMSSLPSLGTERDAEIILMWQETGEKGDRNDSKQVVLGKNADPNGVVFIYWGEKGVSK